MAKKKNRKKGHVKPKPSPKRIIKRPVKRKPKPKPISRTNKKAPIKAKKRVKSGKAKKRIKAISLRQKQRKLLAILRAHISKKKSLLTKYNAFKSCLADYLRSIGKDRWKKHGTFQHILHRLWSKNKTLPVGQLCDNIDTIFETEFYPKPPSRDGDIETVSAMFNQIEWYLFKDNLYFDLMNYPDLVKDGDKVFFVGTPGQISSRNISRGTGSAIDDIHMEMKQLFSDRPSPPPEVVLENIGQTEKGRMVIYYTLAQSSPFKSPKSIPLENRTGFESAYGEEIPSLEQIQAQDAIQERTEEKKEEEKKEEQRKEEPTKEEYEIKIEKEKQRTLQEQSVLTEKITNLIEASSKAGLSPERISQMIEAILQKK